LRSPDVCVQRNSSRQELLRPAGNNAEWLGDLSRVWQIDEGGWEPSTRKLHRPCPASMAT
jgi:hypothetical protein